LAATVPNSASPAPPSTGSGIDAMIAPSLGTSPSATRMMPLTATTKRLLMPVIATSPTFCANALTGKPLSRPPEIVVARVSARRPPTNVRPSAGLPKSCARATHAVRPARGPADDLADREDVGRGLGHDHQHHDDHRHDRGDLELRRP